MSGAIRHEISLMNAGNIEIFAFGCPLVDVPPGAVNFPEHKAAPLPSLWPIEPDRLLASRAKELDRICESLSGQITGALSPES